MQKAKLLARSCRQFYSEGRAVTWFAVCHRPAQPHAVILPGRFFAEDGAPHERIEAAQCEWISKRYKEAGKLLFPLALDLVRWLLERSQGFCGKDF
ncbi:MAG: hypothetical protein MZU79_00250 [Anaerotruncus sp.]|nr:hypothetical protein [Anaerotruncus sp.]